MKKYRNIAMAIFVFLASIIVFTFSLYKYEVAPISSNKEIKKIEIKKGDSISEIANTLKKNNLIKSNLFFKLYIKLTGHDNLKASTYELSENMGVKKIISILEKGNHYNKDNITITFKEGKNMRYIASLIEKNTINNSNDVFSLLKDNNYINELITNYWFLTNDIKANKIYYPLEGYLFPDTYTFLNKEVSVKEIFKVMLDEMEAKLEPYRSQIENNSLSVHELITLASIVEVEGANAIDRKGVAGVFYNRLNDGWILGSDATTYYASKIDDWTTSLTSKELNDCSNNYNTRCKTYSGLPIGPIDNPGMESIEAIINPDVHKYYYFVADCHGKVYLNKNELGHNNTINKLKEDDNWCV